MAASSVNNKHLKCKNLHDYLRTLPGATIDRFYNHPATCIAVFRELPELARHFIMRSLFVEQPIPQAVVTSWIHPSHVKEQFQCVQTLKELRVWQEMPMPGGLPGWIISNVFRKNLKIALLGGGEVWSTCTAAETDRHTKDLDFLDNYAMERWEFVLHYMVGSRQSTERIGGDAIRVLLHSGLMKSEEGEGNPLITQDGFQFLLMDTSSQVWYFMLQYLDTAESRNLDLVECLTFLFQLSFLSLGRDYSTDKMSDSMQTFLQHLREFGLVYQRKRKSGRFYPTRLAINLASGLQYTALDMHRPGYIVVETNYRVYAYTDSDLQVSLLGLFCELLYRLPNMCVAVISRDSVRQALRSGITAEQIVSFLKMHAHNECRKQASSTTSTEGTQTIPPTVVDQIKLWELERDRFTFSEGVLYNQFLSQHDFEVLRNYAKDLGVLVWENPLKRVMVVTRGGHDDVKRFWKRQKHNS